MKSSRRPISISAERIHFPADGIGLKLALSDVISELKPVLHTHENAENSDSNRGIPMAQREIAPTAITNIYMQKNAITFDTKSGDTIL